MVRAGQSREKAALLIYQHFDHERQKEVAGGLDRMVRAVREKARKEREEGSGGSRRLGRSRQRRTPRLMTWGFAEERVTRIELAL
ncbi:hypothetical protein J2S51_003221 [Streptomyces sp. DSM 41269]|nr:hypothetical protein [Streptomyces sp. DSM 41269]